MRKIKLITLLLVGLLAFGLTACSDPSTPEKLDTPSILNRNGNIINWSTVENASKYLIDINGETFESTTTSFDFSVVEASVYTIKVKAVSNSKLFEDSDFSSPFNYVDVSALVQLAVPVINSSIEQGILRWEKVLNATGYHVSINDVIYETNETSYDLSNIILDNYQIKVKAIGDAVTYRDSEYSELLELSPSNMYILSIDDSVTDIITTNISVSSDKAIYGFTFDISYESVNLTITEEDINIESIIPEDWIYDIYIKDGHILVSMTGLEPIQLRLNQLLLTLEFQLVGPTYSIKVESYFIDNNL
ncbi:MAG: hypothetical protein WC185_03430 [Acholeplasmataceae bacterium]